MQHPPPRPANAAGDTLRGELADDNAPPPASLPPDRPAVAQELRLAATLRTLAFAVVVAFAIAGGALLVVSWSLGLSATDIETFVRDLGAWGVAASIGLMVAHSFVPFPAELLAIANGMVYGALWGTVITWSGAMLGAALAFGLARALGRPFVHHLVDRRNWHRLDAWGGREGAFVILLCRLIPLIAFNLINYAAGLTRMSWWTFAWTTGIGILPLTVLMVLLGDSLDRVPWPVWLALPLVALATWLVLARLRRPPSG